MYCKLFFIIIFEIFRYYTALCCLCSFHSLFRQVISRTGFGKGFFYGFFLDKNLMSCQILIIFILCNSGPSLWSFETPSEINQNRIRNLKYLATTERKGGIKVCENSMDMHPFTSPFHVPHESLPHTHGVRESTSFEWSVERTNNYYTANLGTSECSPIVKMLSFQLCRIIYIFVCSYNMKPGCQWSFWTTGFWMALKFFSWNLSHSHKPLINFCCKFVHFNITKALFDFIFYQALTNLVPRVLSFSSHPGSRVVEGPGNEVELWPLLSLQISRFKWVNLAQSWCFMMSESSVGCNCIWGSYLQSKITFSHPNPF